MGWASRCGFAVLLVCLAIGTPNATAQEPDNPTDKKKSPLTKEERLQRIKEKAIQAKEDAVTRRIERSLGRDEDGYFLVAMYEVAPTRRSPVLLFARTHVFDSREAAADAILKYVKDAKSFRRGFRHVARFEPSTDGKEEAEYFHESFQESMESTFPSPPTVESLKADTGDITDRPISVATTITRPASTSNRTKKLVLKLP